MKRSLLLATAVLAGAISAGTAHTADRNGAPNLVGTPVQVRYGRVIRIDAATRYVNAEHFEIVTIENQKGQSFSWQFDTLIAPTGFPLRRIAPPGFECGNTWVYINHPPRHVVTD